ncbi:MAG TPA: hypothetical protein VFE90_02850 [Myxococcales bacterium]|jgi:hypothetical protein|nr:hypothetical protein [Myxococcales bacterium]
MSKNLFIAPFAAVLLASAAQATPLRTLTLRETPQTRDQLAAEVVEVQTHRNAGAVIATDALYGGLAGLAIGGGVALINNDSNWGRDLAIGAGVGLLAGGIFGAVDAATMADRRPVGFGKSFGVTSGHF